jgi:hypothetical protein
LWADTVAVKTHQEAKMTRTAGAMSGTFILMDFYAALKATIAAAQRDQEQNRSVGARSSPAVVKETKHVEGVYAWRRER